jgi:glycosyltransferase involved in cell wall biosynthesis
MDQNVKLSVIVPSRNEKYLNKTVEDLLSKAKGSIEIIEILDGYWEAPIDDPRVKVIHRGEPLGMRAGINAGVAIAQGEYIMKTDAHCMFAEGFDLELIKSCEDQTVIVPRRYRLDALNWKIIEDGRPPVDRMRLTPDLHGKDWQEGNTTAEIEETPSSQGSCWLMKRKYFYELELMDQQTYGPFWSEFQEIGLKCWLSGGRVLVNKRTWYAHLHKTSRGYKLDAKNELKEFSWHKATQPLSWLIKRFS